MLVRRLTCALTCALALGATRQSFADGTETLGDPSIAIASGSGVVAAGTGLFVQPGTIDIMVPGTGVEQVLLYWSGGGVAGSDEDDTIVVDGNEITGTNIGGPTFFFPFQGNNNYSAFRADITAMGLVSNGANSLTVEGLEYGLDNSGAGVMVIYSDGSSASIDLVDGIDLAFINFDGDRQVTVPQTLTFEAADADRTGSLTIFAGSVGQVQRTNTIRVTTSAGVTDSLDLLASTDGELWDTISIDVTIPAGDTELTVEILSGPHGDDPASLSWIAAALNVTNPPDPGAIGDTVYCDENNNGVQDDGEPGIEGVTVQINCDDGTMDSQVTDANGNYLFSDLADGASCEVTVDNSTAPDDKEPGDNCPDAFNVDVVGGESFLDADFCFKNRPGEIGDTVYCDENGNGIQDAVEPGIPGVTVQLNCDDGTMDSQVTDADGKYLFTGIPAGSECTVSVDDTTAGDKIPGTCPLSFTVSVGAGSSFLDADFCFVDPPRGEIGDTVYCDENDNGVQDDGEPGIPDVTVDLNCADGTMDSQQTDADGKYLFTDIAAGECTVSVDTTSPSIGDKVPGQCPLQFVVDLAAGESFLDADFCFREPQGGGQGCTPGFWRQPHHFDHWPAPYTPDMLFSDVFEDAFPGMTLVEVVSQGGGGLNALGRHTVAALLSSSNPNVDYDVSAAGVIDAFNAVYPGSKADYTALKNEFAGFNEQGCPLDNSNALALEIDRVSFIRGDCNSDGRVTGEISDAIFLLQYSFTGGARPECPAACDINGDGEIGGTVSDVIYLLQFNFLGGEAPSAPFPGCDWAQLETDRVLGCEHSRDVCD